MSVELQAIELSSFLSLESSITLRNLAKAYGCSLSDLDTDLYLKLERPYYNDLILQRKKGQVISLTSSFTQYGHIMYDPRITFLINTVSGSGELLIYPLTFASSVEDIREECATVTPDSSSLKSINTESMEKLADTSSALLSKIKRQNWYLLEAQPNPNIKVTKA